MNKDILTIPSKKPHLILFSIITVLLVLGGWWFYLHEYQAIRSRAYDQLKAICELKTGQIVAWRNERIGDARVFASSPFLQSALEQYIKSRGDISKEAALVKSMETIMTSLAYENVMFYSPDGRLLSSFKPVSSDLNTYVRDLIAQVVSAGDVVFGDFFTCAGCEHVHLNVAAPALDETDRILAVMIFCIDPDIYLNPLIQSWPVPSDSAETLIVRKEGEDALFLNALRHSNYPPLTFRIPASRSETPAIQALSGRVGEFEGLDYRGMPVLADIRPVPDSPWIMIAKVDTDEILAESRYRGAVTGVVVFMLVVVAGFGTAFLYKHRGKRTFEALYHAEHLLVEAQEEIRATLYGIGDGVITTDVLGRVKRMNPVAESLTGWSEEEAAGRPLEEIFRIVNEETGTEVVNPVQRVLREGGVVGLANHTLLISRNGRTIPIADSGSPIRNEEGKIIGVVLVFRDQTDERAAQKALHESERAYRTLAENLPCIVYRLHIGEGQGMEFFNDMVGPMTGFTKEELKMGEICSIDSLIHEEDRNRVIDTVKEATRSNSYFHIDYRIRHKDGTVRHFSERGKLVSGDEGKARCIDGVIFDVTDMKQAEEKLRILSQAVEQSPASVTITDLEGRIEYVNSRFTAVTGYRLEELRGKSPAVLKSTETPPGQYGKIWKTVKAGEEWHGILHNRKKDGTPFWGKTTISPIRNEAGRITHFLSIKEDITAQRILEEQLRQIQKLESVGRLAGGVAHDFNNMLSVISGHAEMAMMKMEKSHPLYADLQQILRTAQRSADLTRQLLAFARKQTANPKILDLNDTIAGTLSMLRRLIGENIELIWKPGLEPWPVMIDPAQLDQILVNLAVNARDAITGVGTLSIETDNVMVDETYLDTHAEFTLGEYVRLTVSDTGSGMDPETMEKIFEPFFTTKEVGKGTGLGLSVVYGIVKQNNGFINVYSEKGRGSTFKIYLPRTHVKPTDEQPPSEEKLLRGSETILLVEDEDAVLNLGKDVLEKYGYTVYAARTPGEALSLVRGLQDVVHLLITDVVMPEMNGWELKERLVQQYPKIQVLFMSGYPADIIAHHGVLQKDVQFLQKPFSIKTLAQKVRDVLNR